MFKTLLVLAYQTIALNKLGNVIYQQQNPDQIWLYFSEIVKKKIDKIYTIPFLQRVVMLMCIDGYNESCSLSTGGQQNVSESGTGLLEPNRQGWWVKRGKARFFQVFVCSAVTNSTASSIISPLLKNLPGFLINWWGLCFGLYLFWKRKYFVFGEWSFLVDNQIAFISAYFPEHVPRNTTN